MDGKIIIDFIKDKWIALLLAPSSLVALLSLSVFWYYLSLFDRLDVFISTVGATGTLRIIFFFCVFSLLMAAFIIFMPSILLFCVTGFVSDKTFKKKDDFVSVTLNVLFYSGIFTQLSFLFFIYIDYCYHVGNVILWSGYLLTTAIFTSLCFGLSSKGKLKEYLVRYSKIYMFNIYIYYPFFIMLLMMFQFIPLSIFIKKIKFEDGSSDLLEMVVMFSFMVFVFLMTYAPVFFSLNMKSDSMSSQMKIIISMLITFFFLFVFSVKFPLMNSIISNATLKLSGVSDFRYHNYYLFKKDFPLVLFDKTLWSTREIPGVDDRYFITGVNVFSFAGVKIICPSPIAELYKTTSYFNPFDDSVERKFSDAFRRESRNCLDFKNDEIRLWDSPIN